MGLDVYINYPNDIGSAKSKQYPDHGCDLTYLRSSYNEGGFNSVVGKLIDKDLYYIFGLRFDDIHNMPGYVPYNEDTGEGGEWYPTTEHLLTCKKRAEEVVAELKAISRPLKCFDVSVGNIIKGGDEPTCDATEAIQRVYQEFAKYDEQVEKFKKGEQKYGPFGSYSSANGHFYLDHPVEIIAAIPGKNVLQMPCVHMVYEAKDIEYYVQMAEIVVEMIQTMIDNPGASVSWSG